MKIIIIDSGINKTYICEKTYGHSYVIEDKKIIRDDRYNDDGLHGSMCYKIIRENVPYADIYNIKIVTDGVTSIKQLIIALSWCLDQDCDFINLSLACPKEKDCKELENVCKKLRDKGTCIIASAYNDYKKIAIPATYSSVIGVTNSIKNISRYNMLDSRDAIMIEFDNGKKVFFRGTSKSTALATCKLVEKTKKCNLNKKNPRKAMYSKLNDYEIQKIIYWIQEKFLCNSGYDSLDDFFRDEIKGCDIMIEKIVDELEKNGIKPMRNIYLRYFDDVKIFKFSLKICWGNKKVL